MPVQTKVQRFTTVIGIVVFLAMGTLGAQSTKVDTTGAWTFTVQSDAGTSMPAVTLKQDGEKLSGHYSSMLVGEAELTGTVKGNVIEFVVRAEIQGLALELKYSGTVEGKDSMKGKLSMAGLGDGSFTAKRN
jgi:hypothetical protein